MESGRGLPQSKSLGARAFSLVEIMVSMTLLALIVVGLLAVFNHTQRALRAAHNMTDVFEGARAVVDLVDKDIARLTASQDDLGINIYATDISTNVLPAPGNTSQTNIVQDMFLVYRENDQWTGVGYFIDQRAAGLGTLYRFSTNAYWWETNYFPSSVIAFGNVNVTNAHRVADGVVRFQAHAYDERGRMYTPGWTAALLTNTTVSSNYVSDVLTNIDVGLNHFTFRTDFVPAYIDLEIGILEPQTTRQFNAIAQNSPAAAQTFLQGQLGKMHLFRQRIPVRNHVKPEAF